MKTSKVELSDKERALVWAVMAWFNKSNVGTSTLMQKLYFEDAHAIARKYDQRIEAIIVETGRWLEEHPSTPSDPSEVA